MVYEEDSISNKSQLVALTLLLFFGSLGAHRFYVKKYVTGLLFLIIGSTSLIMKWFGIGYYMIARVAYIIMIIVDLYALYSDSFTDKSGKLVIGKSKTLIYDSDKERDQIIFMDILNKMALLLGAIAFYILYYVITNIVL